MREYFHKSPSISDTNNSLQDISRELISSREDFNIPTPPNISLELQSFLEIMDNSSEWEEFVGNSAIPPICHNDIRTYEDEIYFSPREYTRTNDNNDRETSQVLYNQDSQMNNFSNIVANTSLFRNAEIQPLPSVVPLFLTSQIVSPLDFDKPSTYHESGSLQSITNPIGSSSRVTYDTDTQGMEENFLNVPSDMCRFQNIGIHPSFDYSRTNNDLYDMVVNTDQIIPNHSLVPIHFDNRENETLESIIKRSDRSFQAPSYQDLEQNRSNFLNNPKTNNLDFSSALARPREIGSLELITNSNFESCTSSQLISNQDLQQNDNYFPNIPGADDSIFRNSELTPSTNVAINNDLYDAVFDSDQVISPWDFNLPSTDYINETESLESIMNTWENFPSSCLHEKRIRRE